MVGIVGIKDYGEKENADLGERFGIKTEGGTFPVIKLYLNGNSENPIEYSQSECCYYLIGG